MDALTLKSTLPAIFASIALAANVHAEDVASSPFSVTFAAASTADYAAFDQTEVEDRSEHLTFTAYWENDGGALKRNNLTDRYYTNGIAVSLSHQAKWAADIAPFVPFHENFEGDPSTRYGAGYTVGQLMFTPENPFLRRRINNDRPYAGYLYAGVYWQRSNDFTQDHIQLDLGLVGPSTGADDNQDWIHKMVGDEQFNGWDNQLQDEVTFQFYIRKKWRFDLGGIDVDEMEDAVRFQVIPQVGVALGTVYRHIDGGATLRIGYNLPNDFGPGRLADLGTAASTPNKGFAIYGYLRGTVRAVEHNLFLEGLTFHEGSHSVDEEPVVGELQAGLAASYRWDKISIEGTYSQTFQTREFELQDGSHGFGALTLGLTVWFGSGP